MTAVYPRLQSNHWETGHLPSALEGSNPVYIYLHVAFAIAKKRCGTHFVLLDPIIPPRITETSKMKIQQGNKKSATMISALLLAVLVGSGKAFAPILPPLRFSSPLGFGPSPGTTQKEQGKTVDDVHEFKLEPNYLPQS